MSRGQDARKPLVAGNWKMHKNHFEALSLTQKLAFMLTGKDFDAADIAILPPFTALRSVQTLIAGDKLRIGYGAQDISAHDEGAYTGEVSGAMLAKLGCRYVLVGHSERRQYHGEDDKVVNAKLRAALRARHCARAVRRRDPAGARSGRAAQPHPRPAGRRSRRRGRRAAGGAGSGL